LIITFVIPTTKTNEKQTIKREAKMLKDTLQYVSLINSSVAFCFFASTVAVAPCRLTLLPISIINNRKLNNNPANIENTVSIICIPSLDTTLFNVSNIEIRLSLYNGVKRS